MAGSQVDSVLVGCNHLISVLRLVYVHHKPEKYKLQLMRHDFISSARSVSDMKAHLVISTKYKRKVLTGTMISRLTEVVYVLCQKWDCKMIEFNGEDNHVHLMFQYYPQMDLSKFVGNIKSVSSRKLRQEFPEEINNHYQKKVFWSESYFLASCGGVTVDVLRKYIENQDVPP